MTEEPMQGPPAAAPPEPDTAEPTGDARVDEAMARLDRLSGLPVADQVAEYEEVHRALQDTLATVDDS